MTNESDALAEGQVPERLAVGDPDAPAARFTLATHTGGEGTRAAMQPDTNGRWVLYAQHAARIAALEAEVERLRERERLLIAKIADPETGLYRERADLQDAATAATERAQALEQDGRRYRWLRANWALLTSGNGNALYPLPNPLGGTEFWATRDAVYNVCAPDGLDAAIDAALAAPQGDTP